MKTAVHNTNNTNQGFRSCVPGEATIPGLFPFTATL